MFSQTADETPQEGRNLDPLAEAEAALERGDLEKAEKLFESLKKTGLKARAFRGLAITGFKYRRYEQAEADFRAARELDPEDPETRLGLALALALQQKVYPAIDELESLVVEHPKFVRGRIQAGLLQLKLGAIAKGRAHLQAALAVHPTPGERRAIMGLLDEQDTLDKKRIYRPDFEALRKAKAAAH